MAGGYYGAYKHCVRGIYSDYLGWFEGDLVDLDPLPRDERAARYVALMGGRERLLVESRKALDTGEYQWAGELATWLVRANVEDPEACKLKADAVRQFGYE